MNTVLNLFRDLWNSIGCIGELLGYLLRFISVFFQTRASLAARLVAAESQLSVCKRRVEQKGSPRFRFTAGFRLLWVVLSKFWSPWQAAAQLMQPATVKAWHRGAGLFRCRPGRPVCADADRPLRQSHIQPRALKHPSPILPTFPARARSKCAVRLGQKGRWGFSGGQPKELSIHCARHTLATHLLRKTKNLRQVQKQLGHASPATTANMYADLTFDEMKDGVTGLYGD